MAYGYAAARMPEGTPIVCKNCGGSMRLQPDSSALCGYCGARDQLPADEAGRYLELKNRLAFARSKALQLQGMDVALAHVFEDKRAFFRVSGVYLATALLILFLSVGSLLSNGVSDRVPENYRQSMWMHQLFAPGMVLGVALSFGLGLLGGRSHFRRRVRPLLMARPLQAGHAGFGCRVCGAELRPGADASATCPYCNSVNLLPASHHEASISALNQQAHGMQHDARHAHVSMVSIATRMRRIVIAGVAASFLIVYVVPTLLDRYVFLGK